MTGIGHPDRLSACLTGERDSDTDIIQGEYGKEID